jgi:hypothetical protein
MSVHDGPEDANRDKETIMYENAFIISPLLSLLSGIAILIWPRLLNYIVAFYLILIGLVGLLSHMR